MCPRGRRHHVGRGKSPRGPRFSGYGMASFQSYFCPGVGFPSCVASFGIILHLHMNTITPYSNVKIYINSAIKHLVKSHMPQPQSLLQWHSSSAIATAACRAEAQRSTLIRGNYARLNSLERSRRRPKNLRTCNPRSSYRDLKSIVSRNFTFFMGKPPKMCSSLEQH